MHVNTKNRLLKTISFVTLISIGVALILYAMSDNISFFVTPSQLNDKASVIRTDKEFKIGGLVVDGSIIKLSAQHIKFTITDNISEVQVEHIGYIPGIFRDKQGVVATGVMSGNIFLSRELLAKHDEKYVPIGATPHIK
jgi:cytochrome c-type biogenesis protein CcmE